MKALWRLLTLLRVFIRYRLDILLLKQPIPLALRLLIWCMPWRLLIAPQGSDPERVKLALIALGPIFVKLGQILATRRDLLDDQWAQALGELFDKVPPFDSEQAKAIVEQSLGQKLSAVFACFDSEALASASVAQVHSAKLASGEAVIVKIIRPGIKGIIRHDIGLMRLAANLLEMVVVDAKRLRALEVIEQFEQTLHDELDLQREAANASQIKRNFLGSEVIYIPTVYWSLTNRNILVQERIYGLPVSDVAAVKASGVDCQALAKTGVEIFFTQVFRDNFFHADMHGGNIFVDPDRPHQPRYLAVDFGIVGTLTSADQSYLSRILLAFFEQDYRAIAQLNVDSGWLPADTPVHEFEGAIRALSEPIFAKPLDEISFAQVLLGLFQTGRRFNMQVQPQLVLLQKTLFNIEGLGRQLYPKLDLWEVAQPVLRRWYRQKVSPKQVVKQLQANWPDMAQQLPELPTLLHDALLQQAKSKMDASIQHKKTKRPLWPPLALLTIAVIALLDMPMLSSAFNFIWYDAPVPSLAIFVALVWLIKTFNSNRKK